MTDDGHQPTLGARRAAVKDDPGGADGATVKERLAAAIVDVARELARSVPAPRGAPYFYLDTDAPYDLRVFDSLSERGIFRKYEFALDVGSGLGGRARWLAARTGCRILGIDRDPAAVAAARMLNRRAHMDDQVRFQVGRLDCLPLRAGIFTHVWMLDAEGGVSPEGLREALRVVRPGGYAAVQCATFAGGGQAELLARIRAAGFVEVESRERTLLDVPDVSRLARARLTARLRALADASALPAWARQTPSPATTLQIYARRPA